MTSGELAIARVMFGDDRAFAGVQIVQAPPLGFSAMAPFSGAIIFSAWRAARDFTSAPLAERGWLVHELTHIWQARRGAIMPLAKLSALGSSAYSYALQPGKPFAAYNIEQQAEIARHLFLARCAAPAAGAPPRAALEAVWPAGGDGA